jgi:hypothetical protein
MRRLLILFVVVGLAAWATSTANAAGNILTNGNLDLTHAEEINPPAPGFFLPKPNDWVNVATKGGGPWEDEMSSEPWAGPAPTPVTMDGLANPPHPEGCGGPDCAVFWKPFGGTALEPVTGHLYQDNPGTPGMRYVLMGWAGAEANFLATDAQFAVEFFDGGGMAIGGSVLSLLPGLYVDNGEPFDYKKYTVEAIAPPGTATVRARVSMIEGMGNPLGGGQAFVVDDFTLMCIPEPASVALGLIGMMGLLGLVRRR